MAVNRVPAPSGGPAKVHRNHFPRWRFFTWVILAFNLIMLIWVITGTSSGESCSGLTGDKLTSCQAGQVGTGIGVGLIILLWAIGDVILGVLWLITKPRKRDCPACGNSVRKGLTQCRSCGYDFRTLLPQGASGPAAPPVGRTGQWPDRPVK